MMFLTNNYVQQGFIRLVTMSILHGVVFCIMSLYWPVGNFALSQSLNNRKFGIKPYDFSNREQDQISLNC